MTQEERRIVISQHAKTLAYWLDTKSEFAPVNALPLSEVQKMVARISELSAGLEPMNTQT